MAHHSDRRPVSDDEYREMGGEIRAHFSQVRQLLADDLGGEPEDYEPDE